MAGSRYLDLILDAESMTAITNQRAWVRRLANNGLVRVATAWDWPGLWTVGFFTTVAPYETGTVAVTNGSKTVTGTGTTFTSAMVGRKIRIGGENAYYVIAAFVSTTEVTLEAPYQGDTASGAAYSIYQDEYLLGGDVDTYKLIRQIEDGVALLSKNASEFDRINATPQQTGRARIEVFIGRHVGIYSTGTVTIASGSRSLTGTSTAWLSAPGVSRGTKIRIGSALYTVKSVDSDTAITLYESSGTPATGSAYEAVIDNLKVQLGTIPEDAENYYYRYQRIPAVMDQDADFPDLMPSLHALIVEEMLPWLWNFKGQPEKAQVAKATFRESLANAIARYGHPNTERVYHRASCDISHDPKLATQWLLGV